MPSGIDTARVNAFVQRWYSEYSLPAALYVVPAGFNLAEYGHTHRLDDNTPVFLRDGYIVVNFNIETIRNKDISQPHLQYKNALLDDDVVFYHSDFSRSGEEFWVNWFTQRPPCKLQLSRRSWGRSGCAAKPKTYSPLL